ncbi:MAG: hypothetical protein ACE5G0_11890 [Rhodothermales bacterium]
MPKTVWFGMKLTPEQKKKIKRLAERDGISAKRAVLNAVDLALEEPYPKAQPGSFREGMEEFVGSIEGPADLSTNPKHMEGFGR